MLHNYIKAAFAKFLNIFYGLALLKLLSLSLSKDEFTQYFLYFNASIYLGTLFFSLQWAIALRYHPILGGDTTRKLTQVLTSFSIMGITIITIVYYIATNNLAESATLAALIVSYGLFTLEQYYLRIKQDFSRLVFLFALQIFSALILLFIYRKNLTADLTLILVTISFVLSIVLIRGAKINNHFFIIDLDLLKSHSNIFKYGIPILFVGMCNIMLSSMDQYFLNYYGYNKELPAYIANYNIAEKSIFVSLSIITLVFVPKIFNTYKTLQKETIKDILNIEFIFILLSFIIIAILFFYNQVLTGLLSNPIYTTHSWIIPYISLGGVLLGVTSIMSEILTLNMKTHLVLYSYLLGFVVNFSLNILFIKDYGIKGAISTTIASYSVMLLVTLYFATKEYMAIDNQSRA